jgi:hypothetical protein
MQVGDMDPVGLGIKIAPSGALVEDNPLETQRELAEQEAPEARHQQLLAGREVEADLRGRRHPSRQGP